MPAVGGVPGVGGTSNGGVPAAGGTSNGGMPGAGTAGVSGAGVAGGLGVGGTSAEGGAGGEAGEAGMGGDLGVGGSGTGGSGTGGGAGTNAAGAGGTSSGGVAGSGGTAGSAGKAGAAGAGGSAGGSGGVSGTGGVAGGGMAGAGGAASGCVTGDIRVDYVPGSTNGQIEYDMDVVNVSPFAITANQIEVRYYILQESPGTTLTGTNTVNQLQNPFSAGGGGAITSAVVALGTPTANADHYLKTTFAGTGSIAPNQVLTFKTYYQPANQTQSNDYSFGSQTSKVPWNKIVVLVNGVQQWGCVP
jgi:hypothetical protein